MEEVIGRSKVKDFSLLPCILSDQTDVPRAITYRIKSDKVRLRKKDFNV